MFPVPATLVSWKLGPNQVFCSSLWWREEDSNLRSRPTTDLQSVPFGHSGIPPGKISLGFAKVHLLPCIWSFLPCRSIHCLWSWRWDSNPQPADYKSAALPIELRQRKISLYTNHAGRSSLFAKKRKLFL